VSNGRFIVALVLAASLTACPSAAPPETPKKCPPQNITVSILASASTNPTPTGQPRPVVVRIYQLKNDSRLFNASFEQIWHEDKATLGDDVVKSDEVEVYPATRADVRFDRAEPVEHVAAVALFQDPKGRSWYSSFDLPPPPEPGKCTEQACEEDDEDCTTRAALASHYAVWIDGSKVDDGVEHLDDFPKPGPMKKRGP
jgi:type VI secretion system protein VasD